MGVSNFVFQSLSSSLFFSLKKLKVLIYRFYFHMEMVYIYKDSILYFNTIFFPMLD
jgi:hypothetical protein